jgi:amino acid adenylation domain-containing protein
LTALPNNSKQEVKDRLLHSGFLASCDAMPDRPALCVDGNILTYAQLRRAASSLAATLQRIAPASAPPLTAVFADRSRTGFAGIIGALLAGHGYVPLNPGFPVDRTRRMLQHAGCLAMIVDSKAAAQLESLLDDLEPLLHIILPENEDVGLFARRWPQHAFIGMQDLTPAARWTEPSVSSNALAYLLFTSGSTGLPKGIGVTHSNAVHFVHAMVERYGFTCDDRFSQMFDTTFDLSVFDMFVAWHQGASVYCPGRPMLFNPDRFIREHALTVWFSVPTMGLLMRRFGALKPGSYPSLRWSLFCGEPLPIELADAWTAAAPASTLENLYGPTELTVACTAYRWDRVRSRAESTGGFVPIGTANPGMRARIVDECLRDVAPGEIGELLMAGPQCTPGYWGDRAATDRSFVRFRGADDVYYRTGDRVRAPVGAGPLQYVGRTDDQVKVAGHRVELGEVEAILQQEPGVCQAVAVGWPRTSAGVAGIAAFLTGRDIDVSSARARVRSKLQSYAVPQTIHVLPALPQNANGKVDRQALLSLLHA